MASQMKQFAYLLILLLLAAQADDLWAVAPVLPSAPLADDDEYLPPQRRPQEEPVVHKESAAVGLRHQTAGFPLVRRGLPSEWNLTTPFTPPPLYVFMSLQI
jgi:hypothetical protein